MLKNYPKKRIIAGFTASKGEMANLHKLKEHKLIEFRKHNIKARNNEIRIAKVLEFIKTREAIKELIIKEEIVIQNLLSEDHVEIVFKNITYPAYVIITFSYIELESSQIYEYNSKGGSWIKQDTDLVKQIKIRFKKFDEKYENDNSIVAIIIKWLIYKRSYENIE